MEFSLEGHNLSTLSEEQIISVAKTAPAIHSLGSVTIAKITQAAVLKFGQSVQPSEVENMEFAKHYGICVPKVYKAFNVPINRYDSVGYIVMDYIEGDTLSAVWDSYNGEQKEKVIAQVADMIRRL